jgi:hypothetical protein
MTIALTRGNSEIDGIVFDPKNRLEEAKLEITLILESGPIPQVRRKFDVTGPRFKIKNVNTGTYGLIVRFPGLGIPDRREDVTLGYKDYASVEFRLTEGATISGLLTQDMGRPYAARIELLDCKGVSIFSTTASGQGEFRLAEVPDGQYRFRVWSGSPYFNTQPITVDRQADQRIEIQALQQRWIPK